MTSFASLTPVQAALERAADDLLRSAPADPERPAYTERQLARRMTRQILSLEWLAENAAVVMPQPMRDELKFLASVSRMSREKRRFLNLWMQGWTQNEIAEALRISQQRVSQQIRFALRRCYDATPLSFRRFSYHSIYKPRGRFREKPGLRSCLYCESGYAVGTGCGRYCSGTCREMAWRIRKK